MLYKILERSKMFQRVPALLQTTLEISRMLKKVFKCSSKFQEIPKVIESTQNFKFFRIFQKFLKDFKTFRKFQDFFLEYLRDSQNALEVSQMYDNDLESCTDFQNISVCDKNSEKAPQFLRNFPNS